MLLFNQSQMYLCQGELHPGGPGQLLTVEQAVGGHRGQSRDSSPVVREPGHHGVVDTPLAQ